MVTETLTMLVQITGGITLLALLWLAARAFKKNAAWGLAVLLLAPFSVAAFGIRYWDREKLPLLAYSGALAATLVLLVALFTAWGGWALLEASRNAQQALQSRTLSAAEVDAFRKASLSFAENSGIHYRNERLQSRIERHLSREAESREIDAIARAREEREAQEEFQYEDLYRKAPEKKEHYRLVYKQIRLADARDYIGATVKVTRKNVLEKEYRLTGVTGNSLQLAQRNRGGSFSFSFKRRDIEKIRVLTKEPY